MLREFLEEREEGIVERWLDRVLAAYPADGGAMFKRRTDQFANPVGHSAREGTRALFRILRSGERPGPQADAFLREMLRIRAVQQMPPSTAVGFLFDLKDLVRAELEAAGHDRTEVDALARFDERVDGLALTAFDLYVDFREELAELRIREAQRHVSWIVDRLNADPDRASPPPPPTGAGGSTGSTSEEMEDTRVRGGSV